ncbi:MAG: RNA polymerase subunit sigma [Clostridiales bacterium]|nr:RNA polymerase subunit sigma [Clostridiales bacterium]
MRETDALAMQAKLDPEVLEDFIKQNEYYILKSASKITHRFISKSDDEWSIALQAFHQAIEGYAFDKGSFYSFADLVIRRRLIDYRKGQGKFASEVSVDPYVFDTDVENETEDVAIKIAVAEQVSKKSNDDIKLEIEAINQRFHHYGFTFFELSKCSPKAAKTKKSCAIAINYILQNPLLINEIQRTKLLPIKIIEKNVQVPRKILERHRKYIIAAIEILSGEYPNLAEYLRYIREESK